MILSEETGFPEICVIMARLSGDLIVRSYQEGQQRKGKQPVVLAGNIQKSLRVQPADVLNGSQDHVNQTEPWGTWIRNNGGSGLSQSSSSAVFSGDVSGPFMYLN